MNYFSKRRLQFHLSKIRKKMSLTIPTLPRNRNNCTLFKQRIFTLKKRHNVLLPHLTPATFFGFPKDGKH
jgi:hypothetical protein